MPRPKGSKNKSPRKTAKPTTQSIDFTLRRGIDYTKMVE